MTKSYSRTPSDQDKSNAQLRTEAAALRMRLEAKQQECKALSEELVRLRTRPPEMENSNRRLLNAMQVGFGLAEIILDQAGSPRDYRLLRVNSTFARLTGSSPQEAAGNTARELIPDVDENWIENCGRVALTGHPEYFAVKSQALGKWFEVYAFRYQERRFGQLFIDITTRKQAEQAFANQRELMQSIYDNIPVLLVIWEPRFQRFTRNCHAEATLGWSTAEANKGDFMHTVYPDPAYRRQVIEFMQSLEPGWREWSVTTKDGRSVPIDWANIRLSDDTMIGIGVDLCERRQAEQALRESEDRFMMAAKAARIGAYSRDLKTGEDHWSPEFMAIYGLDPEALLPLEKGLPAGIHSDDWQSILSEARDRMNRTIGPEFNREHRIVRPDGEVRWVMSRGEIEFDDQNRPRRTHGIVMDITERKRLEEHLLEGERRFRSVVENSRDGIYQFDLLNRKFVFISPSLEKLTGFSRREMEREMKKSGHRLHPDDRARAKRDMKHLLSGKNLQQPMEYRWRIKSGEYRWFSETRSILQSDQGEPIAVVGNSRDITDKKRFEIELRQSKEELEMRVRERTIELQRRAEQLSKLSYDLTNAEQRERKRIAHVLHDDLQQILAAAKLHIEGIEKNIQGTYKSDAMKIRALLDASLKTSRSLTMELSPPVLQQKNILAILEWIVGWTQSTHGLTIELKAGTDAEIEEEEIRSLVFQSVRELLFNIVKHARVNQAEIELRCTGDDHLLIIIRDYGKGFDEQTISMEGKLPGGFGLLSIQERLNWIGGHFSFDSSTGAGTCFIIRVPQKPPHLGI